MKERYDNHREDRVSSVGGKRKLPVVYSKEMDGIRQQRVIFYLVFFSFSFYFFNINILYIYIYFLKHIIHIYVGEEIPGSAARVPAVDMANDIRWR